ncbi:fibronectin type III domain-containing protein [Paenibacillus xylanexedens]|uniref:fibronectin type III domain-containing protein n=1 Tax=Paenibacillus xylanexedens TaxID=528191 RepID=UPI003B02708A
MVTGKRKNGFYLWTVRLLVFMLVFGQFGVYGGNRAHAAVGSGIVSSSNDYQYVLTNNNGQLQVNQKSVKLGWVRSYEISTSGYSFRRSQSINGAVEDITKISFGSYTSTYAGKVTNAFIIDFAEVWEYYTTMEYRQSGTNVGVWNNSTVDEFGMTTPRYVQSYEATQLSLVINADTGAVVDFVSNLNPYYIRKAESFSFVKEPGTTQPITTIPAVPTNLAADASDVAINLNWSAAPQAVQYEIEENGIVKGPFYGINYTISSLTPNTTYTYRVRGINRLGASEWSEPVALTTLLEKPVLVVTPEEGKNKIQWMAVESADRYQLQIDGGTPFELGNVTSYVHEGLEANSTHTYVLKAFSASNESAWSKMVSQLTVPDRTNGLTVTDATFNKLTVAWTAVKGATGYDLEIDGTNVAVTGTTYSKTGLAANTEYTFRIRPKNAGGAGSWSDVTTGITQMSTPVIQSNPSQEEVVLIWSPVDGATSYEVETDGVVVGDISDSIYTHTGLKPGTAHKYRVRAISDNNISAWSAVKSQNTLPDSVNGLVVSAATNAAVTVKWTAVTGATGYDLEIDGTVVPVTGVTYTKNGLAANTDHTFRIRSKNAAGAGAWSDLISGITQLNTPILKATSEETAINLTWADVADATKYEIEADGAVVSTVEEPSYSHTALLPGTAHKYRIRALTETNTSAWTAILTQSTIPASVTGLTVSSATNVAIALKWTAVTGATGYDLEIDGTVVPVTGVAYTKSALAANTDHTFRVRSKNAAGVGAWSELINGTTLLNTPVLKASSEETAINLTWVAIADATKYEIEADGAVVAMVEEPSYSHVALLPGTAHKYRIRALTETNTSAWTATLTQSTIPASVTGLTVSTATNAAIALKWTAVTGATGYDLEIDGTVVPVTGVAYTKSGLAANTDHTFRVRSKNAAGVGAWSDFISGTTLLNTPVLKASSEETAVNLTWADVKDATKYEIEADGAVVAKVEEPNYSHVALLPGTAHKYRIRALTETNTSAWTAILTQSTIPASVTGLTVSSATNVAIALKWTAVTGATGYDLEIDGTVVPVTGVAYTKSALAANTDHTFRVRSKNAAGVGAWSELINGTTLLNTPVLKASSEETAINLTWVAIADATKYEIEADGAVVAMVEEPSYSHVALLPGTAHKYRIRAMTENNTSAWTAILTQSTIPASVTGLTVSSATNVAIALKWTTVTGATGYDLEIDGTVVPVTGVAYTKSGLGANTDHTFRIRSKNAAGVGAWSDLISGKTLLNTPVLKTTSEETAINLTWVAIADATKYEIEADGVVVATAEEPSYSHTGQLPGTAHKYRIRAMTDTNTSAWTAVLTQSTIPATVNGFMLNTATTVAISMKWNPVTGATAYDLEIDGVVISASGAVYTKSGLLANTDHTFRIRAKNAAGVGSWSEVVTTSTQLNVPTTLKAVPEESSVTLTWNEVAGATKYEIEADGIVVATVSDLLYVHNGVLGGTIHKYRIRALTDTNVSAWTAILSQTTLPASVSGLSINSATTAAFALRWSAVTGATGYDLEIDGTLVAVSGVAYTKSGLAPNTEHTFRIRAKNASGAGAWSEIIAGMTQLTTPVLKGTSDRTNVILTWDAAVGASSYEIEADGQIVATVSDLTFIQSDLLPSSSHKYRIRAFNDQNSSVWSSVLSIRTLN